MRVILLVGLAFLTHPTFAQTKKSSNIGVSPQINSHPAKSVTCKAVRPSFTAPIPTDTVIANCSVQPASWAGQYTLTSPDGFVMMGNQIVVGGAAYTTPGTVTLTVDVIP